MPGKRGRLTPERFDCFISYARASSNQLAQDLQSGLERFAKPWNRLRAMRVFRDDQSMAANTALWGTIEQGLREARWFVLLATPEAAASRYVNDEVAWWVRNKGAQTVLLVRAGGDIEWDRGTGAFKPGSTAIPPALHHAYQEEPRWIDLTWFDEDGSLGKADPRFQERVADLSSAITGVERDVLIGENVRQHRKTRRLTRAAVSALAVLLVLALSAGAAAFYQRGEALRQRDAAYEQSVLATARQLAATAVNLADFDLQSAMLLATTAYKTRPEHQTELALHAAITRTPQLIGFFDFGEPVTFVDTAADMKMIVGGAESGKVYSLDRASRQRTELFDLHAPIGFLAVADDGKTVAATTSTDHDDGRVTSDSALWHDGNVTRLPGQRLMALSPSGHTRVAMPDAGLNPDVLQITSNGRPDIDHHARVDNELGGPARRCCHRVDERIRPVHAGCHRRLEQRDDADPDGRMDVRRQPVTGRQQLHLHQQRDGYRSMEPRRPAAARVRRLADGGAVRRCQTVRSCAKPQRNPVGDGFRRRHLRQRSPPPRPGHRLHHVARGREVAALIALPFRQHHP